MFTNIQLKMFSFYIISTLSTYFTLVVDGKHRYMHLFLRLHNKPIVNHLLTQTGKYKDKFISNKMQFQKDEYNIILTIAQVERFYVVDWHKISDIAFPFNYFQSIFFFQF